MLGWPFESASTLTVQGWGFWLAIAGLVVSVVGFAITVAQISRTRKAATAVSDEIKKIKFAVEKYDATVESSRAEAALQSATTFLRATNSAQAIVALEQFALSAHTLRELNIPEIASQHDKLNEAISHAARLCERLDKVSDAALPDSELVKIFATMRSHALLMTSVRVALDRSNISEQSAA